MVAHFALRFAYAFWKHTFALSKRLSGPTWIALAVLNAAIAATSFWASQTELVSSSAIPPIAYTETVPTPSVWVLNSPASSWSGKSFNISLGGSNNEHSNVVFTGSHCSVFGHVSYVERVSQQSFFFKLPNIEGLQWRGYHTHFEVGDEPWRFPEIQKLRDQVVLNLTSSDAPSLLTPTEQVVAILVGIFTTFLAAFNAFIAWQVYQRTKTQEILLRLQIAKLERELADQRGQDEKSRKEAEKSSLILLP